MLHEFLEANHDRIIDSCRAKLTDRLGGVFAEESDIGIPSLIDQMIAELRAEQSDGVRSSDVDATIIAIARAQGGQFLRTGLTIDNLVHSYGDVCQAVTELAHEQNARISVEEYRTFNRCLDNAIAGAVTEFGRQRDQSIADAGARTMNERLGFLGHELRNLLNTATLAFQATKLGAVTSSGATGAIIGRSLAGLRDLVDRSLAEVRLTEGLEPRLERVPVAELMDEIRVAAEMEAKAKGVTFAAAKVEGDSWLEVDRQMISSAVANLLQNAFKFTPPGGNVSLTTEVVGDRLSIEVSDQCGGLPPGASEDLFHPFTQRGSNRTGLGLGLSITRRGVEANGGAVHARSNDGEGCVFTIDLPLRGHRDN